MNMNIAASSASTLHTSDLTARARILDTAISLFANEGFAAVSLRRVAVTVGVSPSLVVHHFGSKDNLRAECDIRVLAFVRDKRSRSSDFSALIANAGSYGRYMARMIGDGTSAGNDLFDRLVDESIDAVSQAVADGSMRDVGEPRLVGLVLTIQALAPLLLHGQLARFAGEDVPSADTLRRIAGPTARIYTTGIFTTDAVVSSVEAATK
jgi:TetR/AcrR family transcriptional regulator, regulator of cefoperazone and chloramphenicol sensitivity